MQAEKVHFREISQQPSSIFIRVLFPRSLCCLPFLLSSFLFLFLVVGSSHVFVLGLGQSKHDEHEEEDERKKRRSEGGWEKQSGQLLGRALQNSSSFSHLLSSSSSCCGRFWLSPSIIIIISSWYSWGGIRGGKETEEDKPMMQYWCHITAAVFFLHLVWPLWKRKDGEENER